MEKIIFYSPLLFWFFLSKLGTRDAEYRTGIENFDSRSHEIRNCRNQS